MNMELDKKIDEFLAKNKDEIIENMCKLVRCPSVKAAPLPNAPFGEGTALALKTALEISENYGFSTKNADGLYGLAKLDGAKPDKTIGIISHLDVVPPGNGWHTDPFEPTIKGKYLIGRGVMDDKCAATLGLAVMKFFKEVEKINSSILLFFGCCEETDCTDIMTFAKTEKQPDFSLVPDTSFPVCHGEKGILGIDVKTQKFETLLDFHGGNAHNMVPDLASCSLKFSDDALSALKAKAKEYHEITTENDTILIKSKGISKHAAMPDGSANAIARLAELLLEAKVLTENEETIMTLIANCGNSIHGEAYDLDVSDEPSGRLSMINGVAKFEDGHIILSYNMRYPVTTKGDVYIKRLKEFFTENNLEVLDYNDNAPTYVPADDPKVQTLVKIYEDITGKDGTPYTTGGGTYSRYMKNAIGFGLDDGTIENSNDFEMGHGGIHQPDEAIIIDDFIKAIKIYIHTVYELDKII